MPCNTTLWDYRLPQPEKRHLLADGAAVLAESVRAMKSKFHMDLVAIVHPTVVHSRPILEKLGWLVVEKPDPVLLDPKKGTAFFRETVMKAGCCGLREMLKLHAFKLKQYKKVGWRSFPHIVLLWLLR